MNQCNDPPQGGGEADLSSSPLSRGVLSPPQPPPFSSIPITKFNNININNINSGSGPGGDGFRSRRQRFPQYLSHDEIEKGLTNGHFHCGTLRVHPHKHSQAHVSLQSPNGDDGVNVLIPGHVARNRALHGDRVVIALAPQQTWKPIKSNNQETSKSTTTNTNSNNNTTTTSNNNTTNNNIGKNSNCGKSSHSAASNEQLHQQSHSKSYSQPTDLGYPCDNSTTTTTITDNANHDEFEGDDDDDEEDDDESSFSDLVTTVLSYLTDDDCLEESDDNDNDNHDDEGGTGQFGQTAIPSQSENTIFQFFESSIVSSSDHQNAVPPPSDTHSLTDLCTQLTPVGFVVGIQKACHPKDFVGTLHSCRLDQRILASDRAVLFQPLNPKFPRMILPIGDCPRYFLDDPHSHSTDRFVVRLCKWNVNSILPTARFKKLLGPCGDFEVETESILIENGIDFSDFPSKLVRNLKCHENNTDWKVPKTELKKRRDLRKKRIFTIDPSDTKDIDDALSITVLPNGQFEIGVHIADVSFFVEPNSQLDLEARSRANSVYLSDRVIPMLPAVLSENLCSLRPGVDRLAFSIFWRMNRHGDLLNNEPSWFGKTVIRSCAKLDYRIVQMIIEGQVKSEHQIPANFRATDEHSTNGMIQDVIALHKLASKIRETRFQSGSLHLSRAKFKFQLDEHTHHPMSLEIYEQKDANHLVEEYMLLANFLVARQLVTHCGDLALLRRHCDPRLEPLKKLQNLCKTHNIDLNIESSEALHHSLQSLSASSVGDDQHQNTLHAIQFMASKAMHNAQYCCSGEFSSKEWHHYALNFPLYTHFTSPIRRYTDVIVHRLLEWVADQLQQQQPPHSKSGKYNGRATPSFIDFNTLQQICHISNQKKMDAKRAQDQSSLLFLLGYIASQPEPLIERGVVCSVKKNRLSIFLPRLGIEVTAVDLPPSTPHSVFDTVTVELTCNSTAATNTLAAKLIRE